MTASSTVEVQPTTAVDSKSQLGHWLEEYGEIATILPVLVGILVTTQLRLRGGNALLVNIAIAAITRQAVAQLKKQAGYPTASPAIAGNGADLTAIGAAAPVAEVEDYTIVHSVPGRIRLRISRLLHDAIYARRVEAQLLSEDIVLSVRVNRAASSLIIHYDGTDLSDLELGMRLLHVLEQLEDEDAPS